LKMSLSRIKLNPKCKRVFLQQFWQVNCNTVENEDKPDIDLSKFFHALAISKEFLECSSHFSIYRLHQVECKFDEFNDGLELRCLMANKFNLRPMVEFLVIIEKSQELLRFLKPTFFDVRYPNELFKVMTVNQALEMLHATNGKIGLFSNRKSKSNPLGRSLKQFVASFKEMPYDDIVHDEIELPKMSLDFCEATNLKNIQQLKRMLRHDIKMLKINTDSKHFLADYASDFDSGSNATVRNTSMQQAEIELLGCKYEDFENIVGSLLEFCPNLKGMDVEAKFFAELREFDHEYIIDETMVYRNRIIALKELVPGGHSKKPISFEVEFNHMPGHEYNHAWFGAIKKLFKGWDIHPSYHYDDSDEINCFSVLFTRNDEGCSLNLEITLNWPGQQNDTFALDYPTDQSDLDTAADLDAEDMGNFSDSHMDLN